MWCPVTPGVINTPSTRAREASLQKGSADVACAALSRFRGTLVDLKINTGNAILASNIEKFEAQHNLR